jgi:phytoene synthase
VSLEPAYAHCGEAARTHDRDRWLGALFAPPAARPHLHALIAFEAEMRRLREAVRDPRAGEIRLVWWREAVAGERRDEALGHPVAAALIDTLETFRPSPHLIENAIAGRQADLYDDSFPATSDLEAYLGETRSGLIEIAAIVLGRSAPEASGLAGVALGLTELLRGLARPRALSFAPVDMLERRGATAREFRERIASPGMTDVIGDLAAHARRRLGEAEAARAKLPKALAPAYAGLATAPLWLTAIERNAAQAFESAPEVAAWRRQWALWRWSRRA